MYVHNYYGICQVMSAREGSEKEPAVDRSSVSLFDCQPVRSTLEDLHKDRDDGHTMQSLLLRRWAQV